MLYRILQFILKKSLEVHYRKVKTFNATAVPNTGPLIVAPSHPNSFLDAIIIAVQIDRPLYFLSRSDVFEKKWADYLLRKLHLIPIYQISEDLENSRRNESTFNRCNEVLNQGGALLIFPEGKSEVDKQLHPMKKGLARIAFNFMEKENFNPKLFILPIGVNYEYPTIFKTNVLIGFGFPFTLKPWIKEFKENPNLAYTKFNRYLEHSLQKHLIEVDDANDRLHQSLCQLDPCFEQNSLDRKSLIAKNLSKLKTEKPSGYKNLKALIEETEGKLEKYQLEFKHLKHKVAVSTKNIIWMILLLPISLAGLILNLWPYWAAKKIAARLDKKNKQFTTSVRFAAATLLWLFWVILLTIILFSYNQWFLFTPLLMYFSLKVFLKSKQTVENLFDVIQLNKLKSKSDEYHDLIEHLKRILSYRNSLDIMPKDS